jgi:steroid delta-isomerase-like uncharacterized protein
MNSDLMNSLPGIADQWATAWSSHDVEKVLRLFTDDCLYEDVPTATVNAGKDALRDFAEFFFTVAPDLKIELSSRLETDRRAVCEWKMSGTQQGDIPNLPATHKPFSIRGASILELQEGKVRRCSDYRDMSAFLKQLRWRCGRVRMRKNLRDMWVNSCDGARR